MSPPKVALISEEYPPHIIGGTGTFSYHLAGWLAKKKVSTTIFCGRSRKLSLERVNDFLDVVRLPCLDFPPRYSWFQLQNLSILSKKLADFSVIHATTPEVSPICVYLKNALRKPLVTSFHGVTIYEMKAFINSPASQWSPSDIAFHVLEYPLYHASNRFAIANSNHIITCSHTLLNELRSIYHDFDPRKSSVIYNGIDLEEIVDISTNSNLQRSNENFTLIFYGRLTWLKGIPYLLDAFELLTTEYPNLHLKIYGDGPLRKKIQTIVSKCGLQDRIYIGGKISRSKLLLEIMTADVVVLPSLREAQPISVLEAMACKKPLVVFDLPFASEYIHDSLNGLLAKPQNPNDLAIKIRELLSDKALRTKIGQNAYEYIKDHHNWGYLVNQYIEIYNKLIGISLLS